MKVTIIILLLIVVGSMVAWKLATPTYTYRYRLTVEIDTPDGVRSGSSVYQVETTKYPRWLRGLFGSHSINVQGEAVFVDLGGQRNIVIPVTSKFETLAVKALLKNRANNLSKPEAVKILIQEKPVKALISRNVLPTFITFNDVHSPESAQAIYDVMEKFGEGYNFSEASIELTEDGQTQQIANKLPWLKLTGRPALIAWKKVNHASGLGGSIEPETLFINP